MYDIKLNIVGSFEPISNRYGISYSALKFSNSYAKLPPGKYVGQNFTITAWVQLSIIQAWTKLIEFSNANNADMISIALADADGYPSFKFAYSEVLTGSVKIQAGVWTYIAVTLSNTNGVIYLNNQTIGQMDMRVQNKLTVREVINIGKGVVNWDPAITGTFSDLKIFDQALTPDEIYANQF